MRAPAERLLSAAVVVLVMAGAASCGLEGLVATAPPVPHEEVPAPGTLYLTSRPERAPIPLTIRYLYRGEPSRASDEFAEGALVLVERSLLPEPHGLDVNGAACEGSYPIEIAMETDVLLTIGESGCRVDVIRLHGEQAAAHGETTAFLYGSAPAGSIVRARQLEGERATYTSETDSVPSYRFPALPAGGYEITVELDDEIVLTLTIDLKANEERYLELP